MKLKRSALPARLFTSVSQGIVIVFLICLASSSCAEIIESGKGAARTTAGHPSATGTVKLTGVSRGFEQWRDWLENRRDGQGRHIWLLSKPLPQVSRTNGPGIGVRRCLTGIRRDFFQRPTDANLNNAAQVGGCGANF